MKPHGKGMGIDITSEFTSEINRFKHDFLADVSKGMAPREFKPLKSWPATNHPRQSEIDAFRAVPSKF